MSESPQPQTLDEAIGMLRDIRGLDISAEDAWLDMLLFLGLWAAIVAAVAYAAWRGWCWWQGRQGNGMAWVEEALRTVDKIAQGEDAVREKADRVNELLKQVAIAAGYRQDIAALHGKEWTDWLATITGEGGLSPELQQWLGDQRYAPDQYDVAESEKSWAFVTLAIKKIAKTSEL